MTARRLTGLLIAFLMLHLTFVGASVRCAQGSELSVGGHHANGHHAGMVVGTGARAPSQNPSQNPSHQAPVQPECCRAMMTCAVTVALHEETPSNRELLRDDRIIARLMDVPRSPIAPPDPPPPKV